jgi:hypothetical protein
MISRLMLSAFGAALIVASGEACAQAQALAMQWGRDALSTCGYTEDGGTRNMTAAFVCLSWVSGAVQAASGTVSLEREKPDYCTPEFGGSTGQYVAVYLKYLRDHPEKLHLPSIYLFHQAMAEAFPCKSSR